MKIQSGLLFAILILMSACQSDDDSINDFDFIAPNVRITQPNIAPYEFSPGEEITFEAVLNHPSEEELDIIWSSDLDGVLASEKIAVTERSVFITSSLSGGQHMITVRAEDSKGYSSSYSISINTLCPEPLVLDKPIWNNGSVEMNWSKYEGEDFLRYEVYRASTIFQPLLATISDSEITNYVDNDTSGGYYSSYTIRLVLQNEQGRNSNIETVLLFDGKVLDFESEDVLIHPTANYLYMIDTANNLIMFDYEQLEVVNEIPLSGDIGFCAIGDNGFGVELYVPSSEGHVKIYDAEDLSLNLTLSTDGAAYAVETDKQGFIIVNGDFNYSIKTYDRSSGEFLDAWGVAHKERFKHIVGTSSFISISQNQEPVQLRYYRLDEMGVVEETSQIDLNTNSYNLNNDTMSTRIIHIPNNGEYVIVGTAGYIFSADASLNFINDIGASYCYNCFSGFASIDDGSVIFAASKRFKDVRANNYPGLDLGFSQDLNGEPSFIFYKDGQFIIMGNIGIYDDNYIEILDY